MVFQFKLPDIGEGVHEGEIVQWFVKEGDAVEEDQKILEAMTDKATVEITSPRTGTISAIKAQAGEVVTVGTVILEIQEKGAAPSAKPAAAPAAAPKADEPEEKTLFDLPSDVTGGRRRKKPASPAAAPSAATAQVAVAPARAEGKVLATPATRKLARELGVELGAIPATGERGRVTKVDVQQFATSGGARPPGAKAIAVVPALEVGEEVRVPIRGLRKAIFENMRRSKDHAAHFTYWDEVDVTDLVKLRKDAQKLAETQGVKLSYLPFIVKAVVSGLKQYPHINAHMDEAAMELVTRPHYNIGIAVATERGLMVVVVKHADKKSVFEIAKEIDGLSERARAGKATRDDISGSTFTITSLGKDGGLGATPIVNHPEVAILGIHKIRKTPAVAEDGETIVVRDYMNLSSSFDHRVIDGHIGAAFVQHVIRLLAQPNLLLLGTA